jgi:hypothetical protein
MRLQFEGLATQPGYTPIGDASETEGCEDVAGVLEAGVPAAGTYEVWDDHLEPVHYRDAPVGAHLRDDSRLWAATEVYADRRAAQEFMEVVGAGSMVLCLQNLIMTGDIREDWVPVGLTADLLSFVDTGYAERVELDPETPDRELPEDLEATNYTSFVEMSTDADGNGSQYLYRDWTLIRFDRVVWIFVADHSSQHALVDHSSLMLSVIDRVEDLQ